jgi:hypothetical protein
MLDGLDTQGGRYMGFPCARAADQNGVLCAVEELASMKLTHRRLVDLAGCEVEAGEILVGREACGLQMMGDGAHLALGQFSLEQLGQDRHGGVERRRALLDQIGDGLMMTMAPQAGS